MEYASRDKRLKYLEKSYPKLVELIKSNDPGIKLNSFDILDRSADTEFQFVFSNKTVKTNEEFFRDVNRLLLYRASHIVFTKEKKLRSYSYKCWEVPSVEWEKEIWGSFKLCILDEFLKSIDVTQQEWIEANLRNDNNR